jgi:renalase
MTYRPRLAIIGAGMAGLTLATILAAHGHAPVLFEKSRGAGGRMSTRRAPGHAFDHGAPFFRITSQEFAGFLAPHIAAGGVMPWPRRSRAAQAADEVWVGAPGMNGLCKRLSLGLDMRTEHEIAALQEPGRLRDKAGRDLGTFDWVISTAPAPQTFNLIGAFCPDLAAQYAVRMRGCHAVMIGFDDAPALSWDHAEFADDIIASVCVDSAKPGRTAASLALVVYSNADWSDAHINDDIADIEPVLLRRAADLTSLPIARASHVSTHRWRYATTAVPADRPFFLTPGTRVGACGDWCGTGGVEAAFASGSALAGALLRMLGDSG